MKLISLFLLSIVVLGCIAVPARADSIAIQNPSFEITNPLIYSSPGYGSWNYGPIPGWTITGGGAGSLQPGPTSYPSPLPDGSIVAYSNGGTISQTLSASLLPNTTYTLSVDVGHRLDTPDLYLSNYTIELLAGGTILNALSGSTSFITPGTFQSDFFGFTTGARVPSGNLGIALLSSGPQAEFDNVQLTAALPAPEPGSLLLLATGLGLALFLSRRR